MPFKMEQMVSLGIVIIFIGFIMVFFGMLKGAKEASSKTKVALGGFIGFIPFGFGTDKNFVLFAAVLSLALFILWLIFSVKFAR